MRTIVEWLKSTLFLKIEFHNTHTREYSVFPAHTYLHENNMFTNKMRSSSVAGKGKDRVGLINLFYFMQEFEEVLLGMGYKNI